MKSTRKEINGFGMLIVVAIIAILLIAASGFYIFDSTKNLDDDDSKRNVSREYMETDEDKNYNSENVYETPKPVSTDNSYNSIEGDLNNTVIVEEDFSDL